jgi:isoquinoline 1-oxidoreductase subunit beta
LPYLTDAPVVADVHIVPGTDASVGVGETAVPIISPAVVDALAMGTDTAL